MYSADVAQQRYEYYLKAKGPKLKIDNDYELKAYVEKSIKDKFNEKSDILDDFEWENRNPEDYFLYTMLKKKIKKRQYAKKYHRRKV